MMIKIKSIIGNVLFKHEKENNTIKDTVLEAVKHKVDLRWANLQTANLQGINLQNADLQGVNLRCRLTGSLLTEG